MLEHIFNSRILGRILKSKMLYLGLCIEAVLVVLDHITMYKRYDSVEPLLPQNAYVSWMGFVGVSVYSFIFYTIVPLIVVIPAVNMFCSDINSGFYRQYITRMGKKKYYSEWRKNIFWAGFSIIFVSLLLSLMISLCLYPALKPDQYIGLGPRRDVYFFKIFYYHPLVYSFIYIILNALLGGVLAVISAASYFVYYNKIVSMLFTFLIFYILSVLNNIFDLDYLICPGDFLQPGTSISSWISVATLLGFVCVEKALWFYASHRRDEELIG